jgi:hypothetical protein
MNCQITLLISCQSICHCHVYSQFSSIPADNVCSYLFSMVPPITNGDKHISKVKLHQFKGIYSIISAIYFKPPLIAVCMPWFECGAFLYTQLLILIISHNRHKHYSNKKKFKKKSYERDIIILEGDVFSSFFSFMHTHTDLGYLQ